MRHLSNVIAATLVGCMLAAWAWSCNDHVGTDEIGELYGLDRSLFEQATATEPAVQNVVMPDIYMRLTNQQRANGQTRYDVEFRSSTSGVRLTGMNVRIWISAVQLGWVGMQGFAPGYGPSAPHPAQVSTGSQSSGPALFGFSGPARYVNGGMQLLNPSAPPVYLDEWVKLYEVVFSGVPSCPIVILDKEQNPNAGGFLINDGITMSATIGNSGELYVTEWCEKVNWTQTAAKMPFGHPVECQPL